jgi:hypothetical protein
MAFLCAWRCSGLRLAGSMALYLAYRRSSAPRRVQNSVTRGRPRCRRRAVRACRPRVEVADHAPGAAQPFGGTSSTRGEGVPVGREVRRGDRLQRGFTPASSRHPWRGDVLRADLVEQGEVVEVEEGVGSHGGHFAATPPPSMPLGIANANGRDSAAARSAASSVFTSSIARVIGPTPPGTGVIQPATSLHAVEVDVAAELAGVVAVHADVDDHRAGLDHVGGQHVALADGGDHHVGLQRERLQVGGARCGRW